MCRCGDDSLLLSFSIGFFGSPIGQELWYLTSIKTRIFFLGGCFPHDKVDPASAATIVLVDKASLDSANRLLRDPDSSKATVLCLAGLTARLADESALAANFASASSRSI